MKEGIHPRYGTVYITCASCGNEFTVGSTRLDGAKKEYQGRAYPSMTLEICSQCHPYFSGKQIYVDTAGRVEKFQRRYGSLTGFKIPGEQAERAKPAEPQPQAPLAAAPDKPSEQVEVSAQVAPSPKKRSAPSEETAHQPVAKAESTQEQTASAES